MPPASSLPDAKTGPLELLAEVRAVYAELETRPVSRDCTGRAECCRFKLTGLTPFLTRGEAWVAAQAWRATGRKELPKDESGGSRGTEGVCPMLDPASNRCRIYAARPFGCRTHFCPAAGGPYRRAEVLDLIRRLEAVDARLGGDGIPRPLGSAVVAALASVPRRRG